MAGIAGASANVDVEEIIRKSRAAQKTIVAFRCAEPNT
jgi:hypothetical protein